MFVRDEESNSFMILRRFKINFTSHAQKIWERERNSATRSFWVVGSVIALLFMANVSWNQMMKRLAPVDLSETFNTSVIVVDRNDKLLRAFTTENGRWQLPLSQKDVAPHYYDLLLNFEDKSFL